MSSKPSPDPMLVYHQFELQERTTLKFVLKYIYHSRKYIKKIHLKMLSEKTHFFFSGLSFLTNAYVNSLAPGRFRKVKKKI